MTSPNRAVLTRVARALGPLREELVFVGGQVGELLVTDPAAVRVRPTDDVDVICEVATQSAYDRLAERLRALGFREDLSKDAPLCRWRLGDDILDVLPTEGRVFGFENAWYDYAVGSAVRYPLAEDLEIRIVSAPAFLATKWDAFEDRGGGDPYGSDDIEDIVTVVAGRAEVVEEIRAADEAARRYVADQTRRFIERGATPDVIAGALPDARVVPGMVRAVEQRFVEIAGL